MPVNPADYRNLDFVPRLTDAAVHAWTSGRERVQLRSVRDDATGLWTAWTSLTVHSLSRRLTGSNYFAHRQ